MKANIKEDTTYSNIPYFFSELSQESVDTFNKELSESNYSYKSPFSVLDNIVSISNDKKSLKINEAGRYSFIFQIEYMDGIPKEIKIAYRKETPKYYLYILSEKPDQTTFFDNKYLEDLDSFIARGIYDIDSIVNNNSYIVSSNIGSISISSLKNLYPNAKLYDCATGLEIPYDLFENNEFLMSRNFICYLKEN